MIKNSAHTPGPWGCAYTSNYAHDYRITREDKTPLLLTVIANDHSEQRANARLIAAAPDLLAALQLCERALEERDAEAEEYAAKAARAAIAKATGEI